MSASSASSRAEAAGRTGNATIPTGSPKEDPHEQRTKHLPQPAHAGLPGVCCPLPQEVRHLPWTCHAGGILVVLPVQYPPRHGGLRRGPAPYGHGSSGRGSKHPPARALPAHACRGCTASARHRLPRLVDAAGPDRRGHHPSGHLFLPARQGRAQPLRRP